jgi:glycosyltransferase involved in cell wall biosynthesis
MKPEVTIGICVKNSEKYIGETIRSVLDQDYSHELLEIIVVDGSSTDKTLSIVEKAMDKSGVKNRILSEKQGLGAARQIIVNEAAGEYILWIDGDMIISQDFIRTLSNFMNQNPRVGIVKGKQALEPGKNTVGTLEGFSRALSRMVDYQSKKGFFKTLGTAGAMYRTFVLRQVGGFDKNLKGYNEDWDMEIKVRAAGWYLCTANAWYLDYERLGLTWKDLWRRYWRRGYFTHYFLHKHEGMIKHYRMFPPAAFVSGLLAAVSLYKLTRLKTVFLLPLQSTFKMTAWYVGYVESHLGSYAPPINL